MGPLEPPTTPAWQKVRKQLVPDQPARRQIPPAGSSHPERVGIPADPEQKQLKTEARCSAAGLGREANTCSSQRFKCDNTLLLPLERHSRLSYIPTISGMKGRNTNRDIMSRSEIRL